jgi:uncharacterized small protein (TIGR04563 family)
MPLSVRDSRVDWRWSERSDAERAVIVRYQPLLDAADHVQESFIAILAHAAEGLPGVEVRAIMEDDTGALTLLLAREGKVETIAVGETTRPEHKRIVGRLMTTQKSDLFPVVLSARQRAEAAPGRKLEQELAFPEVVLEEIQKEALRTDRSMSYVVQLAWTFVVDRVKALRDRNEAARYMVPRAGAPKKQPIFFPGEMLIEIEDEAARLEVSMSWVVQLAWALYAG